MCNDIPGKLRDMASSWQEGWTSLMFALKFGHVECVNILLDRGAQANLKNKVRLLCIHYVTCEAWVCAIPGLSCANHGSMVLGHKPWIGCTILGLLIRKACTGDFSCAKYRSLICTYISDG